LLPGKAINITALTYDALSSLSQEFGFVALKQELVKFLASPAFLE
jgi:hypothetical protein